MINFKKIAKMDKGFDNWVDFSQEIFTVGIDNQTNITVTLNASLLNIGNYNTSIVITSNDPYENLVVIPVLLNVTAVDHDIAVINMSVVDTAFLLEETVVNTTIHNYGLSNETNVTVQLLVNGSMVDNHWRNISYSN